jgi:NTE family protein
MHTGNRKRYLCLVLFSLMLSFLFGAENAWSRPTVGLVLSGGGARGAAHVGVIQVLEELNIPVDFIAGASMGSIIGGLYAIGTPPEDIEKLTTKVDWSAMFSDTMPRENQSYRAKAGKENYLLSANFDSQKGLSLPKGLVTGKKLDLTLRALTLGAGENFNAFPIPFSAVATNVETGKMVVLDKGDLAKSLRASMAIPVAFAPVVIDGQQLVDGGVEPPHRCRPTDGGRRGDSRKHRYPVIYS